MRFFEKKKVLQLIHISSHKEDFCMTKTIKILMIVASALSVAAAGLAVAIGVLNVISSAKSVDCCEPEADPFCE